MLTQRGIYEEPGQAASGIESLEKTTLDREIVYDMQQSLNSVNLKRCEEILDSLSGQNFGSEINARIKKIRDAYDMFEYHTVKELISELLDSLL